MKRFWTFLQSYILLLLFFTALGLIWAARYFLLLETPTEFQKELGGLLMDLGGGVIIGGLIKFLLDVYQSSKENKTTSKEFRISLLNELRAVADEVELSRILIRAHKSARTYGIYMREKIMPAAIRLQDIKRSLVDKDDPYLREKVTDIRVHIHYMVAYLEVLTKEYEEKYSDISFIQRIQEALTKKKVAKYIEDKNSAASLNRLTYAWEKIQQLDYCGDFVALFESSLYNKYFYENYRYCKELMRTKNINQTGITLRERYEEMKGNNLVKSNIGLVDTIIKEELEKDILESINQRKN